MISERLTNMKKRRIKPSSVKSIITFSYLAIAGDQSKLVLRQTHRSDIFRREEKMKNDKFSTIKSIALSLTLVGLMIISALAADAVPKISKEKLKDMLDNSDVIILDVRTSKDWQKSESKIKGAIRRRPKLFDSWANEFPRDKVLVLYCA
jgi:hypothetical protein